MKSIFFALLLVLSSGLYAQGTTEAASVRAGISFEGQPKIGEEAMLVVSVMPKEGWHIYSSIASEDGAYQPAEITYEITSKGFTADQPLVEEGKMFDKYDEIMEGTMRYYEENFSFRQPIVLTEEEVIIVGTLDYLACNEIKCVPFTTLFKVAAKAVK